MIMAGAAKSFLRSGVEAALPIGDRSYSRSRQASRSAGPGPETNTKIETSLASAFTAPGAFQIV
jgi:hypothetical protein